MAAQLAKDLKARIEAWIDSMIEPDGPCGGPKEDFLRNLKDSSHEGSDPAYLLWMCDQIVEKSQEWPATRLHRWVGYIQGCLVHGGISTLEDEKTAVREVKKSFSEG
jgi:hypothetical protein